LNFCILHRLHSTLVFSHPYISAATPSARSYWRPVGLPATSRPPRAREWTATSDCSFQRRDSRAGILLPWERWAANRGQPEGSKPQPDPPAAGPFDRSSPPAYASRAARAQHLQCPSALAAGQPVEILSTPGKLKLQATLAIPDPSVCSPYLVHLQASA
jgi:hypothetical protein